jgi:sec-independent protein translocase protein TatB
MFDIGWSELVVIGVVALIVIGPKELPGVLRAVGQWTGKIRRMASEFQDQFREAMREAEMADLKKEIEETTSKLNTSFDPLDYKGSTEWKPAETPAAPIPPAADAPPLPPAEAAAGAPAETPAVSHSTSEPASPSVEKGAEPAPALPPSEGSRPA